MSINFPPDIGWYIDTILMLNITSPRNTLIPMTNPELSMKRMILMQGVARLKIVATSMESGLVIRINPRIRITLLEVTVMVVVCSSEKGC